MSFERGGCVNALYSKARGVLCIVAIGDTCPGHTFRGVKVSRPLATRFRDVFDTFPSEMIKK